MTGDQIIEAVRAFLAIRGQHVLPPDESGNRHWDDPADPLVLIVDPVNHEITSVRESRTREARRWGQTT